MRRVGLSVKRRRKTGEVAKEEVASSNLVSRSKLAPFTIKTDRFLVVSLPRSTAIERGNMPDSPQPCSRLARRKKRPRPVVSGPTTAPVVRSSVPAAELERLSKAWLIAGEISRHSAGTRQNRAGILERFRWFLGERKIATCDTTAVREFLLYVGGSPSWPGYKREAPVKDGTVQTYHRHLRAFFNWLVSEEILDQSPMKRVQEIVNRPDQPDPFTYDEVKRLREATKHSTYQARDDAILHFLLDTGVRVSEMCGLMMDDLDIVGRRATVLGKGNKTRAVYFGNRTARKLFAYAQQEGRLPGQIFFAGEKGMLSRSGVQQLLERIAARAQVTKVHPHRFRHTFAVEFLRAGGDWRTLQELLGHTDIRMTQRYVKLVAADLEAGHRRCSPVERHYSQGSQK